MTEDNRIEQIREVMRFWDRPHNLDRRTALDRIRAILDSAPPAPRVWFPGDTVPAGRTVQNVFGETVLLVDDIDCATATVVEVPVLSLDQWQAAVRQARTRRASEERANPEPPPPRDEPGEWVFRGYDQLGQDVWSWRAIPEPTEGQNHGE